MTLSNAMNREGIYTMMVDMLHEMFELDKSKITLDADLYSDLDIDSIDAVDLVVKLKELTGKRLRPEAFKSIRTVQDVVDALTALQAE